LDMEFDYTVFRIVSQVEKKPKIRNTSLGYPICACTFVYISN